MVICAAFGCDSRSGISQVGFHKFPNEKEDVQRRKVWIDKLNRGETATKKFRPSVHSRLCSKHFEDDQFVFNQKFASEIGYTHKIQRKLKDNAVPTIFPEVSQSLQKTEKRPRLSATAIQEKKLKLEVKESVEKIRTESSGSMTTITEPESTSFYDSESFTAVPLLSPVTTCGTTTTITTSSTSSICMTTQSSPLMWFADIVLTSPKPTSSAVTMTDDSSHSDSIDMTHEVTSALEPTTDSEKKKEFYSTQSQTPHNLVHRRSMLIQAAPVMVDNSTQTKTKLLLPRDRLVAEESFNDSFLSMGSDVHVDPRDPEWTPEGEDSDGENDCEDSVAEDSVAKEKKFIVFESCLLELLQKCSSCGLGQIAESRTMGSCVIYTLKCLNCDVEKTWTSQPMSGTMPYGNLILSGAIMFAGASPVKTLRILNFAGIQTFHLSTYMSIQSLYLTPTILSVWKSSQGELIQQIQDSGQSVKLAGDARCCSPGHTAKYGSYSMMDMHTGKILDIKLVQSNEVKNSYAMELEGLQRSLTFLKDNNVPVSDLITDRHSSVKKYMREKQPDIHHWFDVWHVAKGVYKKLEAAGQKKGCQKVKDWARSVSNHLYWCAASSGGDGELVQQKWLSILNHITNVHEGHGDRFPRCLHDDDLDRDWMKRGFKPYYELEKVVKGKLLVTDVKKLSPDEQTSSLESFHNLVCHYTSKAVHYFHAQMEARLALAAIHFNENTGRAQAVTKSGELRFAVSFPKAKKGEGVAKEVKVDQSFEYVDTLMDRLLQKRYMNRSYSQAKKAKVLEPARPIPIAQSTPARPKKEDIVNSHRSRFNKM